MTTMTTVFARFTQDSSSLGAQSARRRQGGLFSIVVALVAASGCAAAVAPEEGDQEAAGVVEPLVRGGGGVGGASFSCTNGTCTCDKSIENDCEDMTSACTDATVDQVINCINGWLVTHCTCTQMRAAPNPGSPKNPTNLAVKLSASNLSAVAR
jgi:hypothetical protein